MEDSKRVSNASSTLNDAILVNNEKNIAKSLVMPFSLSIVIRTYSLETQAEPAVLRTYLENLAILEPILLYRASKCKQTKEQDSEDCLWTHIFTFL